MFLVYIQKRHASYVSVTPTQWWRSLCCWPTFPLLRRYSRSFQTVPSCVDIRHPRRQISTHLLKLHYLRWVRDSLRAFEIYMHLNYHYNDSRKHTL